MSDPTDRTDAIQDAAAQPAKAQTQALSADAHSLPDQIAADQYAKASAATSKPHRGLRFTKLRMPKMVPIDDTTAAEDDGSYA